MAKAERLKLIESLQKKRGSSVIAYVTSTRMGLEVPMAMDAIRKIFEHLKIAGKKKDDLKIDLFLHSNGGDGIVPWRLVTLIREYATKFSVLVPHRAFSAATLTALGADSIVVHPMGMLGPTDPTVANPFNPQDPNNPAQKIGISVEDVTAFIALIKEDAGIQHEDEMVLAFNKLAEQVHPLALGNVKRSISQSRMMARKLLGLHMDSNRDQQRITDIVDSLTSKLYYHGHPIHRREAKEEIGLTSVEYPEQDVEELIWSLYLEYEKEIRMEEPFQTPFEFTAQNPNLQIGQGAVTPPATAKLAYIESINRTDVLTLDYQLSGQVLPNGSTNVLTIFRKQGWGTE